MSQVLEFGWGSLRFLQRILMEHGFRKPFFVSGRRSFELNDISERLGSQLSGALQGRFVCSASFTDVTVVREALQALRMSDVDVVVPIGGGVVLDVAKLVALYHANGVAEPTKHLDVSGMRPAIPIVAVPTTAGSGSEATQFAVMYVGRVKHSVSHPSLQPVVAVVDPELSSTLPPAVTATSGIDAIAQAIESYWAVMANEESREHAEVALQHALPHFLEAVHRPSRIHRTAMARAAYEAGRAINISRTTAPHALSYTLTSDFGIAHGEAVGLTLPHMLVFNSLSGQNDYQGVIPLEEFHRVFVRLLQILGVSDAEAGRQKLLAMIQKAGLRSRLQEVSSDVEDLMRTLWSGVNEERLVNNPRRMTMEDLSMMLQSV